MITHRVNEKLGTNLNTILTNVYKDGNDCIGYHRDRKTGWAEGTGFATLSFGAERDFQVKHEAVVWSLRCCTGTVMCCICRFQ